VVEGVVYEMLDAQMILITNNIAEGEGKCDNGAPMKTCKQETTTSTHTQEEKDNHTKELEIISNENDELQLDFIKRIVSNTLEDILQGENYISDKSTPHVVDEPIDDLTDDEFDGQEHSAEENVSNYVIERIISGTLDDAIEELKNYESTEDQDDKINTGHVDEEINLNCDVTVMSNHEECE